MHVSAGAGVGASRPASRASGRAAAAEANHLRMGQDSRSSWTAGELARKSNWNRKRGSTLRGAQNRTEPLLTTRFSGRGAARCGDYSFLRENGPGLAPTTGAA